MHNRPSQSGHDIASRQPANATLEMLDDALSKLERRMGIDSTGKQMPRRDEDISAILARQEALARNPRSERPALAPSPGAARDATPLHAELARMREDLNREMSSTIARQFGAIREELKGLMGQGSGIAAADLADGFNRLTRELGVVASRVENTDTGSLRAEVEELRNHVAALAREDTLRDMAERWVVIERELGALPQALGSRQDLMTIAARIAEIHEAMHGLPDTRSFAAMEEQVRALAEAVEVLATQNASVSPDHLYSIETRLDEIARAIAAVSVSNGPVEFDTAPFERIEARLSALARQVEEGAGAHQSAGVEKRLIEIVERLGALHETVSSAPVAGDAFESVAARLENIANRFDRDTAAGASVSNHALDSLNARFEEIAQRLDSQRLSTEQSGERMLQSLDARMEELARRIEDNERESANVPTFDHMERRIEEIAQMLTSGDAFAPGAIAQPDSRALKGLEDQIAALTEKLSHPAPSGGAGDLADLAPRLIAITDQLAGGREDVIAAAREAAEEAIARMSGGISDSEHRVLAQLAGDLRGLEDLARNSDDRNTRTFEAIHDTLVKVADRIAGLESSIRDGSMRDAPKPVSAPPAMPAARQAQSAAPATPSMAAAAPHVEDAPSIDFAVGEDREIEARKAGQRPGRQPVSPAEAAALAARAAAAGGETAMDELAGKVSARRAASPKAQKGILGGLRDAMSRGTAKSADVAVDDELPVVFGKADGARKDPGMADEPLEPGTGGPDLAEIMKRVRAERAGTAADAGSAQDDAGKSDFIAAARRAARAAADEAKVLDTGSGDGGRQKSKRGAGVLAGSRRPLVLGVGAILLALLAFPLVRGYLSHGDVPATTQAEQASPAAVEQAPADPVEQPRVVGAAVDQVTDAAAPVDTADAPVVADQPAADVAAAADMPASDGQDMQAADSTDADMDGTDVAATDTTAADTQAAADYKAITLADIPAQIGPVALREAAVEGDPKALFVIGERLMGSGPGAPGSDMKAAVHWYEMAAELGYAPAQYRVGNAYEKGIGADRDLEAAKTWYQLAAEQGNASAMHNLAVLYATEVDGKRDMETAANWFLKAAELGVKDSQVNLGILAARGEGVQQDLAESYKWLALAAKAGDADAETKRDEVAKFMRPDQLEQARGAVELWKARPVDVAVNSIELPDAWKTSGEATASAPQAPAVDMKKAIRNIQAILNKSGYDAGTADGVMGTKTRSAISQFQKDNGLLPTGEVDKALVDKLLEINKQS